MVNSLNTVLNFIVVKKLFCDQLMPNLEFIIITHLFLLEDTNSMSC